MNRYRNIFHRPVEGLEPGAEGELDLTPQEESDYLRQQRLAILPREYLVIGPRRVCDVAPGEIFSAALSVGQEQALIGAGHIERVERKGKKASDRSE